MRIVRQNPGASLVDLGDGVLAIEFHSKMNAIGGDTVAMMHAGLAEAAANFSAVVVGSEASDFSAGANLMLVLLEAQEGNWDEIDLMIRTFQQANLALKYADVPVIVAPAGLTLGGGCEIVMHGDRVQAAAESYIGLVEVGVGLIPAGGGTKEMMVRASQGAAGARPDALAWSQAVFETIGFARVSTSADHARSLGYIRNRDAVTMNRDRVIADAKAVALERAHEGYRRPQAAPIPVGGETVEAALKLGVHLAWRAGRLSDHDALIGRALAHVIAGGGLPHASTLTESQVLDLEREAFLKLCGERKTLERIQHTLKTGEATPELMRIIERGTGAPLVLVPGLQGRWEYAASTVEALSANWRVLTFSLSDEPSARATTRGRGIDAFADQIEAALDQAGLDRAIVCGVSLGGLVALRFAATRPDRTVALVLASTPGPRFHLKPRHRLYARLPRIFGLLFAIESPMRLNPELRKTFRDAGERWRFRFAQILTLVRAPLSFPRMAARAVAMDRYDRAADCARVSCPVLIVHGDADLDRVVDTAGTLEYATLMPQAQTAHLAGTGHLGSMTKPREFARIVTGYLRTLETANHVGAA